MRSAAFLGMIALAGCGDDEAVCNRDGGAACFALPEAAIDTYAFGGNSPPPQIGCGEVVPTRSLMAVTIGGTVVDYSSAEPVAGVALEVFAANDYQTPIATATTDTTGAYAMDLASDTPDLLWGRITGGGVVPTLFHQLRPDLGQATLDVDYTTGTPELIAAIDAKVEVDADPGLARLVVHVLDCDRYALMDVAVVVSATAGVRDFVDGVPVMYSVTGNAFPLPALNDRSATGTDGAAVAINVPVAGGELYVQAWGFPDAAAVGRGADGLVLIAEHAVTRRAGTMTSVNLWANQD